MLCNFVTVILVIGFTYLLKKILSKDPNVIKFQFNFFIFYFITSVVAFVVCPFFLLNPKNIKNAKNGARLLKHITKIYDLKWELRNGEIIAEDRGAVIVSNHQSSLDVLGQFNVWEVVNNLTVVAKKEIFYVWPFGLAAYLAGVVFIDRKNRKNAFKELEATTEHMVKSKTKIWLFPEGTRNNDYTKLLPFKKGAFVMAVKAQVPILPILFSPYYFINAEKYIFNKGHVVIKCLKPVPTTGLTTDDVPALMNRIHDMMQLEYMQLSKEVLTALPSEYPHTTKE